MKRLTVKIVATGSKGNAYIVEYGNTKFLLDCGVPEADIRDANKKKMCDIQAAFITHAHKDHSGFVDILPKWGIPYFAWDKCEIDGAMPIRTADLIKVKGFPFPFRIIAQEHDAPCAGFDFVLDKDVVLHYVTDTVKINTTPKYADGIRHYWICECDYTTRRMAAVDETESAEVAIRNQRTRQTHLSDETVCEFFNEHDNASGVLIVHTSRLNFDMREFAIKCAECNFTFPVTIGKADAQIDFLV